LYAGGAGGKGVWGAAGMVYEDEEPDLRDPNYDEFAQVRGYSRHGQFIISYFFKGVGTQMKTLGSVPDYFLFSKYFMGSHY